MATVDQISKSNGFKRWNIEQYMTQNEQEANRNRQVKLIQLTKELSKNSRIPKNHSVWSNRDLAVFAGLTFLLGTFIGFLAYSWIAS
jgi:hypothetical protein